MHCKCGWCRLDGLWTLILFLKLHFQGRNFYRAGGNGWNDVKMMHRRPMDSLLLDENVIDSLLKDAQEFLDVEDWYLKQWGESGRNGLR